MNTGCIVQLVRGGTVASGTLMLCTVKDIHIIFHHDNMHPLYITNDETLNNTKLELKAEFRSQFLFKKSNEADYDDQMGESNKSYNYTKIQFETFIHTIYTILYDVIIDSFFCKIHR